jgi:hypothetical protein
MVVMMAVYLEASNPSSVVRADVLTEALRDM